MGFLDLIYAPLGSKKQTYATLGSEILQQF
jgi:hypothetical protein